jgi:nucleotide-binding universal stress UspA family protein
MKRLVVGVDGSDGGRAAIEEAVELASALAARVTFVCVRRSPPGYAGDPYYQNAVTESRAHARLALAEAQDLAEAAGVDAETALLDGDPAERLLDLARERNADMIVVGSHGAGATGSAALGSVSRVVTRHADRPVVVVKREAAPKRLAVHA